ncbi:hypothetical protein SEA_ROBINROSE_93 [Microbacterium phage RobinRose]|nr:hypothetical protein SEA_ROBINROSE_93 [Microbacterium phage RobinRose]WNN94116.1 hypothetical protein SEA_FREGLEY_91 [Microbacterium phage Fregley]WNT44299.1 hypothetical protein SEA_CANDC_88 [Microbacterium phage CandC]
MSTIIETVETYITFGVQYKEFPQHPDEDHPQGMFGDGYAVIEAPNRGAARDIAFALFGKRWAFDYPEKPNSDLYPAGEILRVPLITRSALLAAQSVIRDTYEKAEGDSNDDEIESLQGARDLLEQLVGVIA